MAMRDPKEWASWIIAKSPLNEAFDEDFFARLIREAQEDGAREWKRVAETRLGGVGANILREGFDFGERVTELEAQVAALTERAERAEREVQEMRDAKRYSADEAMGRVCPACGW